MVGSYGQEIHEMTEMRVTALGQYGHNNQPSHHIPFLFALVDDPVTTQTLVRKIINHCYGVDFYAGDEDNGEMGAWFVEAALGMFSVVPGTRDYVITSPLFKHVRVNYNQNIPFENYYAQSYDEQFPNGEPPTADSHDTTNDRYLDIIALGTSATNIVIDSVYINDELVTGPVLDHRKIVGKNVLRYKFKDNDDDTVYANYVKNYFSGVGSTSTSSTSSGIADGSAKLVRKDDKPQIQTNSLSSSQQVDAETIQYHHSSHKQHNQQHYSSSSSSDTGDEIDVAELCRVIWSMVNHLHFFAYLAVVSGCVLTLYCCSVKVCEVFGCCAPFTSASGDVLADNASIGSSNNLKPNYMNGFWLYSGSCMRLLFLRVRSVSSSSSSGKPLSKYTV